MNKFYIILLVVLLLVFGCVQQPTAGNGTGQPPIVIPPSSPPSAQVVSQQYDTQVSIDPSQRHQIMFGFGGFLDRFDNPHMLYGAEQGLPKDTVPQGDKEKILDLVYSDLEIDTMTVGLSASPSKSYDGWKGWEPENDNSDPNSIDWSKMMFDSSHQNVSFLDGVLPLAVKAQERIRARGGRPILIFRNAWAKEHWMTNEYGGLKDSMEEEYAEWMLTAILYAKNQYNLTVDYLAVVNEPDGAGTMSPQQMTKLVKVTGKMFEQNGVPTKLIGPEVYDPSFGPSYLKAIVSDPEASKYYGLITYHTYDRDLSVNELGNVTAREEIRDLTEQLNVPSLDSEISACCKADYQFWNDTYDQALAWANDFHNEFTVTDAGGMDMQLAFWNRQDVSSYVYLLFDENKNYAGYKLASFYYPLGQYIKFVRPGMVRVDATSNNSDVLVSAYINDNDKSVVIVAINNADEERNASVSFASGAPTTLTGTMSSETENWKDIGNAQIENGQFSVTLAPRSVTTLVVK